MIEERKNSTELLLKSPIDRDKILLGSFKAKLLRTIQKRKYKNSLAAIEMKDSGEINFLMMKMRLMQLENHSSDSITGTVKTKSEKALNRIYNALKINE
jgi:hypothetical protein